MISIAVHLNLEGNSQTFPFELFALYAGGELQGAKGAEPLPSVKLSPKLLVLALLSKCIDQTFKGFCIAMINFELLHGY